MSKKWIITLLAWYAAGLAIALKYKKEARQEKLNIDTEEKKPTIIEDIVDIHKHAFSEIKNKMQSTIEECKDIESLKEKASFTLESFKKEADNLLETLKSSEENGVEKIEDALKYLYDKKTELLKEVKDHGNTLNDEMTDTKDDFIHWVESLKAQLDSSYQEILDIIQRKDTSSKK